MKVDRKALKRFVMFGFMARCGSLVNEVSEEISANVEALAMG